jgi:hypothetical protein
MILCQSRRTSPHYSIRPYDTPFRIFESYLLKGKRLIGLKIPHGSPKGRTLWEEASLDLAAL